MFVYSEIVFIFALSNDTTTQIYKIILIMKAVYNNTNGVVCVE